MSLPRKLYISVFLLLSILMISACAATTSLQIQNLGGLSYSMKTLDGLFFQSNEGELCLISGTETTEGSFSQAFVYNIDRDQMVMTQVLDNCRSMTAFCEAGTEIYFATISASADWGCDIYVWDIDSGIFRNCAHLEKKKGIYAMAWDGENRIFVATSQPAGLYSYDISSGEVHEICADFTEELYVRSLAYVNGMCYLGIGTKAALYEVDVTSGEYRSILPEMWSDDAYVYTQAVFGDDIYLLLSPSYTILKYDTKDRTFTDTDLKYEETSVLEEAALLSDSFEGTTVNLLGDLLLINEDRMIGNLSFGTKVSYLDEGAHVIHGLTSSGFYQRISPEGKILFQRDISELVEKSYVIPTEFLVYDNVAFSPGRRFVVRDIDSGMEKVFLVMDEPQASTVTKDGIYTANYTDCTIYFYPFDIFDQPSDSVNMNESDLFLLADIEHQCRPSQMEVTADGRYLVVGSGPMYGQFGGAVSVYDLEADVLLYTDFNVVPGHTIQSVKCSVANPKNVWLGTSPYGENTSPICLDEPSHLILWDIEHEKILLDIIPDEESKKIPSIAEQQGRVYCVTQASHLLSFDAETGQALETNLNSGIKEIITTTDGRLLGISDTAVLSIDSNTLQAKTIADGFTFLTHLTEDPVTGSLYVFDDTEMIQIPLK